MRLKIFLLIWLSLKYCGKYMYYKCSREVAFRYFFATENELFFSFISKFSLIGIIIGVAAFVVMMAVVNGFREELSKTIFGLNSDMIISPLGNHIRYLEELVSKIKVQPYVKDNSICKWSMSCHIFSQFFRCCD